MPALPLKKTFPCTILLPPFFNFSESPSPLGELIKIYFHPLLKKWWGAVSELCIYVTILKVLVFSLKHKNKLQMAENPIKIIQYVSVLYHIFSLFFEHKT